MNASFFYRFNLVFIKFSKTIKVDGLSKFDSIKEI